MAKCIWALGLVLALLMPLAQADTDGIFDEATTKGLSCAWSDCRACAQYRKMCGGVARDFSVLEAEVLAAVAAEEASETDSATPDDPVDETDSRDEDGNEDEGAEQETPVEVQNEDQDENQGEAPEESEQDQEQSGPEDADSPVSGPAPNDNHEAPADGGNLESIPTLGAAGLALLFALMLLLGPRYRTHSLRS